jgi:hypothetical protein
MLAVLFAFIDFTTLKTMAIFIALTVIKSWGLKLTANCLRIDVCYFALQTFQALHKFNRQNNSTKPMLVAGAVN